jgi:hypothetical protein
MLRMDAWSAVTVFSMPWMVAVELSRLFSVTQAESLTLRECQALSLTDLRIFVAGVIAPRRGGPLSGGLKGRGNKAQG